MGNGTSINVWSEAWTLGTGLNFVPTPRETCDATMRGADLIDFDNHGWNVEKVQAIVHECD